MKISVYIASLKPCWFPKDPLYIPIQVGRCFAEKSFTEVTDADGDNISQKNKTYCELTALYWMWKNDQSSDYLGLCHYRRLFAEKSVGNKKKRILRSSHLEKMISQYPTAVFVPKKRNYLWDTLYSHYANTHSATHLDVARQIMEEKCPDYLSAFDQTLKQHSAHMFNMFIMRKETAAEYCEWIFAILSEMEKKIDTSNMSAFNARLFGRISELLFNVWLNKNQIQCETIGYVNLSKTKWFGKIKAYLCAKLFKKKLNQSY